MSNNSLLRNILPKELLSDESRITVKSQFRHIVETAVRVDRLRTPRPAKNLNEFFDLVKNVINDFERRENIISDARIHFTEEDADYPKDKNVIIAFSLVKREPGSFSQGHPFEERNRVKNLVPLFREEVEDQENPGYRRAILGYIHDNEIKFTIWARTNKVANERALWFEGLMQEYSWYFTSQGVSRCLFLKRDKDFITEYNGLKMYGRPIHFFLRTETLTTISQKKIESIEIESGLPDSSSS